jgi:uracil-DNA glycosylase
MVLGHDFHSEAGYGESLKRGAESLNQPTWKNLLDVFDRAEIRPAECFFTNVYMGLRAGTKTTGPFAGARSAEFVTHCQQFLAAQIEAQRPSLIVTLGTIAPRVLSRLSPELSVWNAPVGLKGLNNSHALIQRVTFPNLPGFDTTAVALIHPCLRRPNLRHRKYRGLEGDAAEIRMLRDARRIVASRAT